MTMEKVNPIPEGYHTINPYIMVEVLTEEEITKQITPKTRG